MDVRDHTATSDSRLDECVKLLVTADSELQVTRGDALDLEVLARVASELEHLGGEVLEDRSSVHGSGGAHSLNGGEQWREFKLIGGKVQNI